MVKEIVQTIKREPSVWSAVCGGNKKLSVLGVYFCCQKVGRRPVSNMNVLKGTLDHDSYAVMCGTCCVARVITV